MVIIPFLVYACFEKDRRVEPYPGIVYTINDSIQLYQSYFDLESGETIKSYRADEWQLGFECGMNGWHIIVNSGAYWFIYTKGLYDIPSAFPDSTAVGNWVNTMETGYSYTNHVYLLGRLVTNGFDEIRQIKFLSLTDSTYTFFYKENSGEYSDTVTIQKNDSVNFVYYSFPHRKQENLEPAKSSYDIVFGPYYDLATEFGVTIPYHVAGAMLNSWDTKSYLDSIHDYSAISFETMDLQSFGSQRDIPGYRWKSVSVDVSGSGTATYTVKPYYVYLFQTSQTNFFKLRFLSYTLDGKSGFPRFEYRALTPLELNP